MSPSYAAGCLAIKFGVFSWKRSNLRDALLKCERDHVELVAQEISTPVGAKAEPLQRLLDYIREHRHQFVDLSSGSDGGDRRLGYRNQHKDSREFLFTKAVFEGIAGGKKAAIDLKKELDKRGLIVTTGAGKQGKRYVARRRLSTDPKAGRQSFVAVAETILNVGLDTEA